MWDLCFSARWLLHFAFCNSVQERRLGELRWMLRRASLACRCRRWGWGRRPGWTLSGRKRPRPASQHLISRWRCSRGHGWWRIQEMSWKLSCCCSSQLQILTPTVPCHHIEEKENCRNNKHWKFFCKRGTFHAKQLLQRSTYDKHKKDWSLIVSWSRKLRKIVFLVKCGGLKKVIEIEAMQNSHSTLHKIAL